MHSITSVYMHGKPPLTSPCFSARAVEGNRNFIDNIRVTNARDMEKLMRTMEARSAKTKGQGDAYSVRLVSETGEHAIMPLEDARREAERRGMEMMVVSADSVPPVVRYDILSLSFSFFLSLFPLVKYRHSYCMKSSTVHVQRRDACVFTRTECSLACFFSSKRSIHEFNVEC